MINRRAFMAGTSAALTTLALPHARAADAATAASRELLGQLSDELLTLYPDDASYFGVDVGSRLPLRHRLTDVTLQGVSDRAASCAAGLRSLQRLDSAALTGIDAVNLEVARYAYALADEGYRQFQFGDNVVLHAQQAESNTPYVVNQQTGYFSYIPDILDEQHRIESAADAEAYLERVAAYARGLDGETERIRRDAGVGAVPPDFLLDKSIAQEGAYLGKPVENWGLVSSLVRRTQEHRIPGDWAARARQVCAGEVAPALSRQLAALKDLRKHATHEAGCWKVKNGDAYYHWLLKVGTTSTLSPAEVHRMGLAQNLDYQSQMDHLLRSQGLRQGSVGVRLANLAKDPRFLYPNTDAGRTQLLDYLNGIIAAVRSKLPQAFATQQKADLVIRRVPPATEIGAPNGFEVSGPLDGSRPSIYFINLHDMANWPRFHLPSLCFHEGIPGHVWQGNFTNALPILRSQLTFNAYIEGWALYAEQLGDELGMYADDPFGRLGYLQAMQFRACRLVVDTGLHAKRWTREQAIQWLLENTGNPLGYVTSEVDRYCATPGQACGYKIGHQRINALRTKAKTALGPKFDIRTFHDALLTSGSVPLAVLDGIIERFIDTQQA